MLFNIFSYQQKSSKGVIVMQLFGGALFAVNFFMLGAVVGGLLNVIAVFRAIVYSNKEKFRAKSKVWIYLFVSLYVLSYILTFTLFGTPFTLKNAILELLPVIAMIATTLGFYVNNAAFIRKMGLICCPGWLIYNIFNLAVGAIICEAVSICSVIIGIIRLDIKKARRRVVLLTTAHPTNCSTGRY